jgi:hypothetical protein
MTWVNEATNDDLLVGHQFGPQPVSRLNLFLLNDIVIHHLDVAEAAGITYRPSADVLTKQVEMWATFDVFLPSPGLGLWESAVHASGRTVPLA